MRRLLFAPLLLSGLVGCDDDRGDVGYAPDPRPQEPAAAEIEIKVLDSITKLPVSGVPVVSNDSLGGILDRGETAEDGTAALEYEVGGTVSIFWEDETSDPMPIRSTDSYVITEGLTSIQHVVVGAPIDYTNPPIQLELDVEPVPGALGYAAIIACSPEPNSYETFVAGDATGEPLPIILPEFRGCPGRDTFSVFMMAIDADLEMVGYDMLIDAPMPQTGAFSHTFSPTRTATESFTVRFDGLSPGTELSGHALRLGPSAVAANLLEGHDFELVASQTSESWTTSVLRVPLPLHLDIEADFPEADGRCSNARRRTSFPQAFDLTWQADRLAKIELDGDVVRFGPGDPGDVGMVSDVQSYPDHFRTISYHFPWKTVANEADERLVFHPVLPDDLEVRFGFAGEDMSTWTLDLHGVSGYEAAIESGIDYREGYEVRTLYACPP